MKCIAVYRYPREGTLCRYIENEDSELDLMHDSGNPRYASAFVFAPFEQGGEKTMVSFNAGCTREMQLGDVENLSCPVYDVEEDAPSTLDERAGYAADFKTFHDALQSGQYSKLVLSRSHLVKMDAVPQCMHLFARAARQNPNCFVALVSTPQTGTWLTATPEILVEQQGGVFKTMALAGTQKFDATKGEASLESVEWDAKNRREQACVAEYIRRRLDAMNIGYTESHPTTARAGTLAHIKTDFTFGIASVPGLTPLQIAARLHPTPAVCGLPAIEAKNFITENEHTSRSYYSGFCGTVDMQRSEAHLFVTLRCMRIASTVCTLYAGGGLLAESDEEDEWTETNNKMLAMRKALTE